MALVASGFVDLHPSGLRLESEGLVVIVTPKEQEPYLEPTQLHI